jgi:transmembrane secretion effector
MRPDRVTTLARAAHSCWPAAGRCCCCSRNSISLIGWWLERVAVGWLTWTLTYSGAWLGLISFADFLPVFFLAPFAGVLADRRDRVRTIRVTQWIGCVQVSLLGILVVSDAMTIEILLAPGLMLGIASGVAQPSRARQMYRPRELADASRERRPLAPECSCTPAGTGHRLSQHNSCLKQLRAARVLADPIAIAPGR